MVTQPLYKKIKEMIMQMAVAGTKGEHLPSVGELASRFAVNPQMVDRAYRELQREGYLVLSEDGEMHPAEERFVADSKRKELLQQFDQLVRKLMMLSIEPEELEERVSMLAKRRLEF